METTLSALELPDPDSLPSADIVIWDGECNFCQAQVERLHRWDSGKLAYLSLHDRRVAELCPNLSHDQLMQQMWVVTRDKHAWGGADAARYLSTKLPRLWWLMPLLHFPFSMPVWRWLYSKIAARRYRISGKNCSSGTCKLH